MSERRTGRTTKQLNETLQYVREINNRCNRAYYVIHAKHFEEHCRNILNELGATKEEQKRIRFISSFELERFRMYDLKAFWDHYAVETTGYVKYYHHKKFEEMRAK